MAYRPNSRAIATIAATVLTAVIAGHCAAQSAPISEEAITPNPSFKFQRDDDNNWEAAKDLSGVACLGELEDLVRQCIFVNDSGRFVVPADFDISSLTLAVKGRVEIVNNDAEEQGPTFGSTIDPASVECGQLEDYGGFDGEAVTISPDADGRDIVYIVGGCDRNNPTYKESTFLVATLAPFIKVPLSLRLSEALRTTAGLSDTSASGCRTMESASRVWLPSAIASCSASGRPLLVRNLQSTPTRLFMATPSSSASVAMRCSRPTKASSPTPSRSPWAPGDP